jgi:hypothetical protein
MRDDESYPTPVSDPDSGGIPDYADDDSTAYDDVDSPREADGYKPATLPRDREEGPAGLDDIATTPEGQRQGESLDDRLSQEEPDVGEDDLPTPGSALLDEATSEGQEATANQDVEILDGGTTQWPDADSPVSMYDREGLDPMTEGRVGRLVQPDSGAQADDEPDEIATATGAAGGGPGAEELAMHEIPDEDR